MEECHERYQNHYIFILDINKLFKVYIFCQIEWLSPDLSWKSVSMYRFIDNKLPHCFVLIFHALLFHCLHCNFESFPQLTWVKQLINAVHISHASQHWRPMAGARRTTDSVAELLTVEDTDSCWGLRTVYYFFPEIGLNWTETFHDQVPKLLLQEQLPLQSNKQGCFINR